MKKDQNIFISKKNGFTLVELLVVIAIIAILATVGITIYGNSQKTARDARRQTDLDAISNALEVNKTTAGYQSLGSTNFAAGVVPQDPIGGASGNTTHGGYCISSATTGTLGSVPTLAQLYTATANTCNVTAVSGVGANGTAWSSVASGVPAANTTIWMVCIGTGETGTSATGVVCQTSRQ